MEYDHEKTAIDIIDRTYENLIKLEKNTDYEFTLLINSLFGLLIVPFEYYRFEFKKGEDKIVREKGIKEADLREYSKEEYENILNIINKQNPYNTYRMDNKHPEFSVSNFIKHLRNALAHPKNGFLDKGDGGNVTGAYFYDEKGKEQFCVYLSKEDIKDLAINIARMYKNTYKKAKNMDCINDEYTKKLNEKEDIWNEHKKNHQFFIIR